MDIICHTLSGTAVGTVIAAQSSKSNLHKISIILLGTLGGALPDFDAISLWSKFDSTIGIFFHLTRTGKEIYFSKLWYSHHSALHSFTAAFSIPILLLFIRSLLLKEKFFKLISKTKFYILSFSLGFSIHLFEDMPTPYCVWGGVRLLFPSIEYFGGYGKIWWWNNYDLFLIIVAVILINLIILLLGKKGKPKILTFVTFITGILLFIYQINTRSFDFNYKGHNVNHQQYEQKSKEIQKDILGERIYSIMEKFDNSVQVNF